MTRLTCLLVLLAGPSLALDPARCEWERPGFSEYERAFPVQDLGGGLVVQSILHDDAHAARDGAPNMSRTLVEFCATGRMLQVDGLHVALLHNSVAGARVVSWGAYLLGHEQAFSRPLPHDELA